MKKYESKQEQTGNIFEWQFIGEVDTTNREYQKELFRLQEEAAQKGATNRHIPYDKAMELARKFQPFDPTHPNKPFARDIRISLLDLMINKKLITNSEEDQDRVKFYTAVKTPLDLFHGVDAFIEYKDIDNKRYPVTLDLTLTKSKRVYRSDVVINELPDPELDKEKIKYLATVEQYANKVLGCIEMKKSNEEIKGR